MTRILAGLRGRRDADLSREQAEAEAARYAASEATARRVAADREVGDLERRLVALGDLEARREELASQREREIAADPAAGATVQALAELASRAGAKQAEIVQLGEALTAATAARIALGEAATLLGKAGDWATYDTFLGGGLVTDLVKYDRLDGAGALMRQADLALAHLATELADVGIGAVGEIGVTELARVFDVWFDNIFSDWAVRDRIRQASGRVTALIGGVDLTAREVQRRLGLARTALDDLRAERERLLTG
jgi:hypothetical protein